MAKVNLQSLSVDPGRGLGNLSPLSRPISSFSPPFLPLLLVIWPLVWIALCWSPLGVDPGDPEGHRDLMLVAQLESRLDETPAEATNTPPPPSPTPVVTSPTLDSTETPTPEQVSPTPDVFVPPAAGLKFISIWIDELLGENEDAEQARQKRETLDYYQQIGANNKKVGVKTLSDFKRRFCFSVDAGGLCTTPGEDVWAYYFNTSDLGLGREMHCRYFTGLMPSDISIIGQFDGLACYVTNYGDKPNGDPVVAMTDLMTEVEGHGQTHLATVAMVAWNCEGNRSCLDHSPVRFYAYGKQDPESTEETLLTVLALDSQGPKPIPHTCVACHGGLLQNEGGRVTAVKTHFLPFLLEGLKFVDEIDGLDAPVAYSAAAQAESMRKLNAMVREAATWNGNNAADAIRDYVDGAYAPEGVNTPGANYHTDFVPAGYQDQGGPQTRVYHDVIKPYCQGCHLAQVGTLDFSSYDRLAENVVFVADAVCGAHLDDEFRLGLGGIEFYMPHSEIAYLKWWADQRAQATLVKDFFGIVIPDADVTCPSDESTTYP